MYCMQVKPYQWSLAILHPLAVSLHDINVAVESCHQRIVRHLLDKTPLLRLYIYIHKLTTLSFELGNTWQYLAILSKLYGYTNLVTMLCSLSLTHTHTHTHTPPSLSISLLSQ